MSRKHGLIFVLSNLDRKGEDEKGGSEKKRRGGFWKRKSTPSWRDFFLRVSPGHDFRLQGRRANLVLGAQP